MNTMKAEIRSPSAKAKHLRKAGFVPCCIYGSELKESIPIQIPHREAMQLLRKKDEGSKIAIEVGNQKVITLIKDVSKNELKNEIEHISFHALSANRKVNSTAKVILCNRDKVPGYISQALFEIPYTALPADIVDTVLIDLENHQIGSRITVADLDIAKDEKIELLIDADNMVLNIIEHKKS